MLATILILVCVFSHVADKRRNTGKDKNSTDDEGGNG